MSERPLVRARLAERTAFGPSRRLAEALLPAADPGAAAVAAVVVAMAWSVNARQIRLAELLARRQFPVSSGNVTAKESTPEVEGGAAAAEGASRGKPAAKVPPEVIDGPDEVVAGEQARYRVQTGGPHQVVSWAVGGGGAVSPVHFLNRSLTGEALAQTYLPDGRQFSLRSNGALE